MLSVPMPTTRDCGVRHVMPSWSLSGSTGRCFRVSSIGGSTRHRDLWLRDQRTEGRRATPRADSSQFDRYSDCFDGAAWHVVRNACDRVAGWQGSALCIGEAKFDSKRCPTFKAVCGTQTRLDGFQNNPGQKVNPSSACPAPWWVASKEVGQTALTYELVEQVVNETPLNAVSGLMRSQNADSLSGYAEIPSKVGEPPLKGRSSPYNKRRAR